MLIEQKFHPIRLASARITPVTDGRGVAAKPANTGVSQIGTHNAITTVPSESPKLSGNDNWN